jgi:hypothetical protein
MSLYRRRVPMSRYSPASLCTRRMSSWSVTSRRSSSNTGLETMSARAHSLAFRSSRLGKTTPCSLADRQGQASATVRLPVCPTYRDDTVVSDNPPTPSSSAPHRRSLPHSRRPTTPGPVSRRRAGSVRGQGRARGVEKNLRRRAGCFGMSDWSLGGTPQQGVAKKTFIDRTRSWIHGLSYRRWHRPLQLIGTSRPGIRPLAGRSWLATHCRRDRG